MLLTVLLAVDAPEVTLEVIPVARPCIVLRHTTGLASTGVASSTSSAAILGFEECASAAAAAAT